MELLDKKFKAHKKQFVLQCLLATVSVLVILIVLEAITSAAILAALGASACVVFAIPESESSKPKVILGGYLIGVMVGTACHWPAQLEATGHPVMDKYLSLVCIAGAVGMTIFLMTITNTEHPPAVGVALGLAAGRWNWQTIAVVLIGVIALCIAKRLLRSWLRNLV